MDEKIFLSVIIPAFNETDRIPATLGKVKSYLGKQKYTYEVIVVDDGSTDGMAKIVEDFIKGWKGFRTISYGENQGKGYAVKKGMLEAKGSWRLLMDADNSTDISEIEKFLKHTSNLEVIIGSRYLENSSIKVKQPFERRIVSRFGNWLTKLMTGLDIIDTQCGFKLFSARAATDIFPRQTINRWAFDIEILAIAKQRNYKIKEVPVDWYNAAGSQVSKTAALQTFKELWQIRKNIRLKKYNF